MALFKRPDLQAKGLNDEQIDYIMTEANRSLSRNYTLTSDVQGQIDAARAEWEKGQPDPKESEEYLKLKHDFDTYKDEQEAVASEAYAGVKPKFRHQVYSMVDRGDGAESVEKQLAGIREKYEEYFTPAQQQTKPPVFGGPVQGSMPKGDEGAVDAFSKAWGFGPRK